MVSCSKVDRARRAERFIAGHLSSHRNPLEWVESSSSLTEVNLTDPTSYIYPPLGLPGAYTLFSWGIIRLCTLVSPAKVDHPGPYGRVVKDAIPFFQPDSFPKVLEKRLFTCRLTRGRFWIFLRNKAHCIYVIYSQVMRLRLIRICHWIPQGKTRYLSEIILMKSLPNSWTKYDDMIPTNTSKTLCVKITAVRPRRENKGEDRFELITSPYKGK